MKDRETNGESNVWNTAQRFEHTMLLFGLNEVIDQLTGSVCWYGHLLWREGGHVFRKALELEVQRRKGRVRRMWLRQVEEECIKDGLIR